MIVVDASVLAPVVTGHGADGSKFRRRLRGETIAVPDLARIEVISVIQRQCRSGDLDNSQATRALDDLIDLPLIVYATASLLRRAWVLLDNVSPYDACYVALAEMLDCTLLTADARLSGSPAVTCAVEVL